MPSSRFTLHLNGFPESASKLFTWNVDGNPKFLAGPYKMVTLFFRMLLTDKGSIIGRPNEGTEFYSLLDGNFSDQRELHDKLLEVFEDAFVQVQDVQQRNTLAGHIVTPDELLISYKMTEFFVASDGQKALAKIELSNAVGEAVTGALPINP